MKTFIATDYFAPGCKDRYKLFNIFFWLFYEKAWCKQYLSPHIESQFKRSKKLQYSRSCIFVCQKRMVIEFKILWTVSIRRKTGHYKPNCTISSPLIQNGQDLTFKLLEIYHTPEDKIYIQPANKQIIHIFCKYFFIRGITFNFRLI